MGGRPGGPDLTVGPIGKTLITFALPVLGSNILQSLNGSANAFWVSRVLGEAGLTATNNANQIFFMMLGAAFGVTMAANIMIGQAIGARDEATARRVVGTATTFFIAISLLIGVAGGALTPHILAAMRTPPDARADAIAYLRVIFAAMPFMFFFNFMMMAQRGTGDSRTPFYFALLQVGLDITRCAAGKFRTAALTSGVRCGVSTFAKQPHSPALNARGRGARVGYGSPRL